MSSSAPSKHAHPKHAHALPLATTLGALGIVYGDIGTSPLYAFKEAVRAATASGAPVGPAAIGAVSLIFWSLIVIVSLKYAILILRADNRGEGGIVAILALLRARHAKRGSWRSYLLLVGLIGAALLYGDGAITPAISVLSAVEGLKVDAPGLGRFVVPITVVILIGLFLVQRKGTDFIGGIFGPVMLGWFVLIGILGIGGIVLAPGVLAGLDPFRAIGFLLHAAPAVSFAMIGAAFLAVTGGEAMYADMGHFGRQPIRLAWFAIVLPCLVLNYFGQAALLQVEPGAIDHPFYALAPDWLHYPLVAFATLAAIIASQAIISGAFSLTQQAIQLGFLPFMRIKQTAAHAKGQIYVPLVNWMLAAATLGAVIGFGSSDALAGAYGIAVSLLMAITTLLAALVALKWRYNPLLVAAVNGSFLVVDLVFLSGNLVKLEEGGWFPLLLAGAIAFLMLTWRRGRALVEAARAHMRQPEAAFLKGLAETCPIRLPGSAVFLSASPTGIPLPLNHFVRHNHALHERVVLATLLIEEAPRIPPEERVTVSELGQGISRIVLHVGFAENPVIPTGLQQAVAEGKLTGIDLATTSYYIGRETVIASEAIPGMAVWREGVFAFMQRNAERSAAYFCIPVKQVVEIGMEIDI